MLRPTTKIIFASLVGTTLEWYDYVIFALLSPVLSTLFFPANDQTVSLLLAFTVYAMGYFVRPVSAYIFGRIGDGYGRKRALLLAISLMTLPAFFMGFLPTYQTIGLWAPMLMLVFRIAQGFSVSGETPSALVLAYESVPARYQSMMTCLAWMGTVLGILLASLMMTGLNFIFSEKTILEGAWRIPFWISLLTGLLGWWIRMKLQESPVYLAHQHKRDPAQSIHAVFSENKVALLKIIAFFAPNAVLFFLIYIYLPSFLIKMQIFPAATVHWVNALMLFSLSITTVLAGWLSTRFGAKNFILLGTLIYIPTLPFLYQAAISGSLIALITSDFMVGCVMSLIAGGMVVTVTGLAAPRVRMTTFAVGYNLCMAIFSGTAPIIFLWLSKWIAWRGGVALYPVVLFLLTLPIIFKMPACAKTQSEAS